MSAATWQQAIDREVLALFDGGSTSLAELLSALPGLDPIAVALLLRKARPNADLTAVSSAPKGRNPTTVRLPTQHPLDYNWRFDDLTRDTLLEFAITGSSASGALAIFGAPTVAHRAVELSIDRRVMLFDRDRALEDIFRHHRSKLQLTCVDLLNECVDFSDVDVAIVDPPWYPEHTCAFLWNARMSLRNGGQALLSLPPVNTRPGILDERGSLFRSAKEMGFSVLSLNESSLTYVTPAFEWSSLRSLHISDPLTTWRRGDLALLIVDGDNRLPFPAHTVDENWTEVELRGVRIRFRADSQPDFRSPLLRNLLPGDILATVSRRDQIRAQVQVWTSANRVFACAAPGILMSIANAMATGLDPKSAVAPIIGRSLTSQEVLEIDAAVVQMQELVKQERSDMRQYQTWTGQAD